MGNKGKQNSSSQSQSNSYSSSQSVSNTDSRAYSNTDSRAYSNTDSRQYSNIDSRDMSTNVNNVDNRNISDISLDCGVNPSDVENYTNNESININQDNSQNIVVSGDGNTLSNITQSMNLTSYGPTVQKCMQDAVSEMASANQTDLAASKSNETGASNTSQNSNDNTSTNSNTNTSSNTSGQSSSNTQSNEQKTEQKSELSQTAGFGSGGLEMILVIVIALIIFYSMSNQDSNALRYFTELFSTDFTSTHLILILLSLIIFYEIMN
mgnify:CR=1 FL=1